MLLRHSWTLFLTLPGLQDSPAMLPDPIPTPAGATRRSCNTSDAPIDAVLLELQNVPASLVDAISIAAEAMVRACNTPRRCLYCSKDHIMT